MRPAAALFHEEQYFDWKVYALIGSLEALCGLAILGWTHRADVAGLLTHAWSLEFLLGLSAGLGLPFLLIVSVLHMTTEAAADVVTVWYGWVPIYRRTINLADVKSCEVVRYRPIADYGGWGVRRLADGDRALTARGDRGVRLVLADGSRLLIGSQRPEDLADVLARSARPDAA
ncbi:hypothetical protein [Paludisphaera mucosa]|uniref:Uncharacterized protein n=1 Tax=Paludisphaera mucosa TaxID=3030827 RepID=A0ABT6FBW2_9BACT|nr:hypothetical protein [Paludisphaera mucosa]MDG3005071.1 hypothetical protein [Paludisphaera mucosa]